MQFAEAFPGAAPPPPTDWKMARRAILAGLDLGAEYSSLGLRLAGTAHNGKIQAHAMGRPDESPSAFINLNTGGYYAHGDPPESLSFFDFALKYGRFGDWSECIRHYAARAGWANMPIRKTNKGWVEEARYPYLGRDGDVLYEVIRYRQPNGRKTFRQRQPEAGGGWRYDLDGLTRVLYRLPELIARPDEWVYLVEGEKDADALHDAGLLATTAPQGAEAAGRKYWDAGLYDADLAGRHVAILPDNDPTGRAFSRSIAARLHGKAASVRIVELPGLAPKGDASDWIEAGGDPSEIPALADATPVYDPDAPDANAEPDPEGDATAADLIAANAGTRWLWPGWIPTSVLTLLTAEPSTGKTRLCLDLQRRISLGLPWPDGAPIQLQDGVLPRVLWVAADHQHAELADAPSKFGYPPDACYLNSSRSDLYGGTELQTPEQLADFEERIKRVKPALVVIDTVTNTGDFKSQDSSDAKRQYKPLQEVAKRTGCAMLVVTHTNVAGKTLGRRADEKTRVTIRVERPDPEGQPHRRKLSVALSRLSVYPPPLGVTMHDSGNDYDNTPPEDPENAQAAQGAKLPSPAIQEAIGYLTTRLAMGACKVGMIRREAEQREPPISAKSLYAAVRHLGIEEFEQEDRKWWRLAAKDGGDEGGPEVCPPF